MGFTSYEPVIKPAIFEHEDCDSINLGFLPYQGTDILLGVSVKLRSDGTVEPAVSGEDIIGVICKQKGKDGKVTVRTNFLSILNAKAEGTIVQGALAKLDTANTTTNAQVTVIAVAQGNYASYRALTGATDGQDIQVGVLYSPIVKS